MGNTPYFTVQQCDEVESALWLLSSIHTLKDPAWMRQQIQEATERGEGGLVALLRGLCYVNFRLMELAVGAIGDGRVDNTALLAQIREQVESDRAAAQEGE